jgi:hypothetical protein
LERVVPSVSSHLDGDICIGVDDEKQLRASQTSLRGDLLRGAVSDFESSKEVRVVTEELTVGKQAFKGRLASYGQQESL